MSYPLLRDNTRVAHRHLPALWIYPRPIISSTKLTSTTSGDIRLRAVVSGVVVVPAEVEAVVVLAEVEVEVVLEVEGVVAVVLCYRSTPVRSHFAHIGCRPVQVHRRRGERHNAATARILHAPTRTIADIYEQGDPAKSVLSVKKNDEDDVG